MVRATRTVTAKARAGFVDGGGDMRSLSRVRCFYANPLARGAAGRIRSAIIIVCGPCCRPSLAGYSVKERRSNDGYNYLRIRRVSHS